ncbi:MAG: site-specific DNA-methyltransferase [Oscillibacter sp.]|nr:site-specific DNA-methyltransferase [Oscillibacter sp.]
MVNPTLMQGDCLELMRDIPDGSVDMILTDPPYSSGGLFAGDRKVSTRTKYTSLEYNGAARFPNFSGDNMDQRSFTEFMRMVFCAARVKAKTGAVIAVFVDWRNLPALTDAVQAAGWVWRGIVVWDKGISRNQPGRFRPDCEYVVWGSNGQKDVDWTPGQPALPGCYRVKSVSTQRKHHQTEKPVELLENLLSICPKDGTVLDLFMGSGSTGVACANTGRKFIGMELDPSYFETARRRIEDAMAQIRMEDVI